MGRFYTYIQNNSGGWFQVDNDVCEYVIIEANNLCHANDRAKDIGIYFNGCEDGYDCECCGDRWYEPWQDEGTDEPMLYNDQAQTYRSYYGEQLCYIYYLNGQKETINIHKKNWQSK